MQLVHYSVECDDSHWISQTQDALNADKREEEYTALTAHCTDAMQLVAQAPHAEMSECALRSESH